MNQNRRHFSRVAFDAPAQLVTARERYEVKVIDLSFKGALVRVPERAALRAGMPCNLQVTLAETDAGIAMSTEVSHVQDGRAGLQCRSIDIDSMTHLRRLIEFQLGDPALLQRELGALVAL